MDNFEDSLTSIRTEWHVTKEKWFAGEQMDPVFEGTVRDFCAFDDTMQKVHKKVQVFMRGVEQLATGMMTLSEGMSGLSLTNDHFIASDSCKLKEATNQIARSDAPHSAIAKLRRDMHFNILTPVQNHITNNRNLKVSLDIRKRRLIELNNAKQSFENVRKKNVPHTDRRHLQAQSNFEAAKMTFNDVDRHVFEWLYILEEYRGDILDSTLQTLKYLEYEFFASSAHAISQSLPSRMEFRPMVEMTPEHLEAQVDMELQKSEDNEATASLGGSADTTIIDFSARLIDKKVKDDPGEIAALPVDPLSLSSLLSQGFEEGPARKALRKHQNNTQAALDWLVNGQVEEEEKTKLASDGVRLPTTVKRVQKLKAMRRAQQEKLKEKREVEADEAEGGGSRSSAGGRGGESLHSGRASESRDHRDRDEGGRDHRDRDRERERDRDRDAEPRQEREPHRETTPARPSPPDDMLPGLSPQAGSKAPPPPPPDLLDGLSDDRGQPPANCASGMGDLLSLGEERPAVPTDFSRPLDLTSLPEQMSFDLTKCEKPPLAAAVAAGIVQPRTGAPAPLPDSALDGGLADAFQQQQQQQQPMQRQHAQQPISPTSASAAGLAAGLAALSAGAVQNAATFAQGAAKSPPSPAGQKDVFGDLGGLANLTAGGSGDGGYPGGHS